MPHEAATTPLRILVIAPTPFFADRGCHVRIYEQCRALIQAGHSVTICTYHLGRDVDDIEIRRSLHVPWYRKLSAGPSLHKFYIDGLLLCTVLRQCLRRRPDVIHAHLHEGAVIGRIAGLLFGVPMVADLQGSLAAELAQHRFIREQGGAHRLLTAAERFITRLPDVVLASSGGTLASLPGISADDGRARVLPDGIDRRVFHADAAGRASVRERLRIEPQAQVVGYLGLLTDYQGVPVLLRAAQRVVHDSSRPPRFLIMGYPDVERYRAMAEELGISSQVTFTGRIPYDEACAYLSACDLAISPKLSRTEANGKLLNYLAVGLPIIASDTPINREILGSAGILTPPGDGCALAEAIMHVLGDNRISADLSRRSLRCAQHFCLGTLDERLADIYREAIGIGPATSAPEPQTLPTS